MMQRATIARVAWLVLGVACGASRARRDAASETAYVAAQIAQWDALLTTIPDSIPREATWLMTGERWEATLRCATSSHEWDAPDLVNVLFDDSVSKERQREILERVQGRVVSRVGPYYHVWLRPTGRCDARRVADELKKVQGVRFALPSFYFTSGAQ